MSYLPRDGFLLSRNMLHCNFTMHKVVVIDCCYTPVYLQHDEKFHIKPFNYRQR